MWVSGECRCPREGTRAAAAYVAAATSAVSCTTRSCREEPCAPIAAAILSAHRLPRSALPPPPLPLPQRWSRLPELCIHCAKHSVRMKGLLFDVVIFGSNVEAAPNLLWSGPKQTLHMKVAVDTTYVYQG
eukprot:gene4809-biopygen8702